MRYQSKSTISYLIRNFWRLVPWTVAAAVLSGFFLSDRPVIDFIHAYADGAITGSNLIERLMRAVTVLRFGRYWWCTLLTLLLLVFCESILIVKVARHMRVGEMLPFPIKGAVSVLPMALALTLGVTVFYELASMAVVGVAALIRSASVIATVIVSAVLLFAVRALTVFFASALLLSFPIMFEENYRFGSALSYSVRMALHKRKFLIVITLVYPLTQLAIAALCAWVNVQALTVTLYALFVLFFSTYAPCVAFTMYYDSVGGVRRDVTHTIF